jgi:hypothetical protein
MRRLLHTFAVWLLSVSLAAAQTGVGQIANGHLLANASGSAAVAADTAPSSWFDQAYCNTIGNLIVRFTGAWTCSKSIAANPVWWGADPTGVSDSASAFNSALAANTYVQFPAGKFRFLSQISYSVSTAPGSVTIAGTGQDNTILFWPSGSGIALTLSNFRHSFHIRDLTLSSGGAPGGTALAVSNTVGGVLAQNDVINVTIRGDDYGTANYWAIGTNITIVNDVNFINVNFIGLNSGGTAPDLGSGIGVQMQGNATGPIYAFNYNFTNVYFTQLATGISVNSYVQGIYVTQSSFEGQTGILINNGMAGTLCCLSVTNTQFATRQGFSVLSTFYQYAFSNNVFFLDTNGIGLSVVKSGGGTVSGNIFQPTGVGIANNIGVYLGQSQTPLMDTMIYGNLFYLINYGVFLDTGSSLVNIQANGFSSLTTPVNFIAPSVAAQYVVANNIGYNPVSCCTVTSTGTSASVISAGASPETHYITQSANFNAVVAKCAALACGTSTNICTVPSATVPCVLSLGPNESYKVTWVTTQPTYTKDIH